MNPIISLLDNDLYTFTVQQLIFHKHTDVNVKYRFKWRNWHQMSIGITLKDFVGRLKEQVDQFCELKFTEEELNYLSSIYFLKPSYIEYLKLFKPNRKHIKIGIVNEQLDITVEGPWLNTIIFEVPVLSMISQLYTENSKLSDHKYFFSNGLKILHDKCELLKTDYSRGLKFSDFGTRRRASFEWQDSILSYLLSDVKNNLVGTSNVYFAKKHGIKPIGTMSHQYLQAYQQIKGGNLEDSQQRALQDWANEYRGELGIALSDCLTFDFFLKDFDRYFALLFDGCRHDSGNPYEWCEKLIKHYESLRIDPRTKTAVFSDGLNFELAIKLYNKFGHKINTAFGIGTNLTNDCGFTAPQIVIKMVECNGRSVAKVSDSPGKGMCEDQEYLTYLKSIIARKQAPRI